MYSGSIAAAGTNSSIAISSAATASSALSSELDSPTKLPRGWHDLLDRGRVGRGRLERLELRLRQLDEATARELVALDDVVPRHLAVLRTDVLLVQSLAAVLMRSE